MDSAPSLAGDAAGSRRAWPWILVAGAAIACFAGTLGHGLVQDDVEIRTSPLLGQPFDVLRVWRGGFFAPQFAHLALYRPLALWTLLLNARVNEILFGDPLSGPGFHVGNVLLHAGASLMLFAWIRSLSLPRGAALAGALLFAVHPVHTEAVANVSARSEPLALLFGLAFLLAHGRGRPILAALLFLLALWSKESAVGFAAVAVAADLLLPKRLARRRGPDELASIAPAPDERSGSRLRRWIPIAVVLVLWLALRAGALRGASPAIAFLDNPAASAGAWPRILTAAAVQLDYLRLLVFPLRQSIDYGFAATRVVESALDPRVVAFLAVAIVAVLGAVRLRSAAPELALGLAAYAAFFAVTSNVLFPIGSIEAERLAYLPSAAFCLVAGAGLARVPRGIAIACVATVGLAFGAKAWAESRAWKDESTLFRASVAKSPESAKAHLQLGQVLEREGDLEGAARECRTSTTIYDAYAPTWFLLGNALHGLHRTKDAVDAWRAALRADAGLSDVRANLCGALLELGRRDEAIVEMRALVSADPLHERLPSIQDDLARSASEADVAAARADVAAARTALAARDVARALQSAQRAVLSGALARAERREALLALADAWRASGRERGAEIFAAAAARLSP